MSTADGRCSFAPAGTYGHECGKTATLTAILKSDTTKSGLFYASRCAECAKIRGGENAGVLRMEPLDQAKHVNEFKR